MIPALELMDGKSTSMGAEVIVGNKVGTNLSTFTQVWIKGGETDDTLTLAGGPDLSLSGGTIEGGAGTDTLRLVSDWPYARFRLSDLAVFSGIEIIRGSSARDDISIRADQLASVVTIDGGVNAYGDENTLTLAGTNLDLRSLTLLNIDRISVATNDATLTLDDKALALKVSAYSAQNDHLVLEGATFTEAERTLLHSEGVDRITDASGITSVNEAPILANLDGEAIRATPGQTVFLDVGADATVADDGGTLRSLSFRFNDSILPSESLGLDTSGAVRLSDGLFEDSTVSVDNVEIGSIRYSGTSGFSVWLNGAASLEHINKLLQAVTYINVSGDPDFTAHRSIVVTAQDHGSREDNAVVRVTVAKPGVVVLSSEADNLVGTGADETFIAMVGGISSGDALEGGGGYDTLRLFALDIEPWDSFTWDLTSLGEIHNIEKLAGTEAEETIHLDAKALASFSAIDGGGPTNGFGDELRLHGQNLDLRNKTILDIETISLADHGATLLLSDAALAGRIEAYAKSNTHVVLEGQTFTAGQRFSLFMSGIDKITDASGTYTEYVYEMPPVLSVIPGTAGADNLIGDPWKNEIRGMAGDDTIVGGNSEDALWGDEGRDQVSGGNGNDKLFGGIGKDTLKGEAGNDTIKGGADSDTLIGSTGKDVFVFDTKLNKKTNLDRIVDFSVKDDTIWLDNAIFKKLGKGTELKPGKLNKKFFSLGSAKDKDDYLVYDSKKGVLFYDADGSGKAKAVEIATLKKGLKMTTADFMVI